MRSGRSPLRIWPWERATHSKILALSNPEHRLLLPHMRRNAAMHPALTSYVSISEAKRPRKQSECAVHRCNMIGTCVMTASRSNLNLPDDFCHFCTKLQKDSSCQDISKDRGWSFVGPQHEGRANHAHGTCSHCSTCKISNARLSHWNGALQGHGATLHLSYCASDIHTVQNFLCQKHAQQNKLDGHLCTATLGFPGNLE